MKIRSLTIDNVKSFREATTIRLADDVNILVGPNAGGKSDEIVILRRNGTSLTGFRLPARDRDWNANTALQGPVAYG